MRVLMALVMMTVVACSSSDDEAPAVGTGHGPCAQRSGSFLMQYTRRTGSCGDIAETISNVPQQPTGPVAPCTGSISYSADNCEVTYDNTCPTDAIVKGGSGSVTGHSKWSVDGAYGEATESLAFFNADKAAICAGTYDVKATRQ